MQTSDFLHYGNITRCGSGPEHFGFPKPSIIGDYEMPVNYVKFLIVFEWLMAEKIS
jgi:hypothetical protein